ncbi:MAG: hypothetical protein JXM79_01930 [Sedimentisphaerales bacterium]|nr:hypothetical protein [Sedimentisphaerales bacterium]
MYDWLLSIDSGKMSGKIVITALDLHVAKQKAIQELRKYLPEKRNLYLESKGNGIYTVVSNLEDVGEIVIRRLEHA